MLEIERSIFFVQPLQEQDARGNCMNAMTLEMTNPTLCFPRVIAAAPGVFLSTQGFLIREEQAFGWGRCRSISVQIRRQTVTKI